MCGFLLYKSFNLKKDKNVHKRFDKALSMIKHRGPDLTSKILKEKANTIIGFHKLNIRDINLGSQSIEDRLNKIILCFNGEIFNDDIIKAELIKKCHKFKTEISETEAILKGYKEWGINIFQKLRGFFAILIVDYSINKLFLVRDYNRIKPLYFFNSK